MGFWVHLFIIIIFILFYRSLILLSTTTAGSYLAVQENYQTAPLRRLQQMALH